MQIQLHSTQDDREASVELLLANLSREERQPLTNNSGFEGPNLKRKNVAETDVCDFNIHVYSWR